MLRRYQFFFVRPIVFNQDDYIFKFCTSQTQYKLPHVKKLQVHQNERENDGQEMQNFSTLFSLELSFSITSTQK